MRPATLLLVLAVAILLPGNALLAEGERAPGEISWFTSLPEAYTAAKEKDLPLMICINAQRVDGGRLEPAAQELRMFTYKAPAVIEKAKGFVCAFLTSEGTSDDYGELRSRYGIDGDIVSPQHIFAYPDGRLIYRKEFWPYGTGQRAVDKLLEMMEEALAKDRARRGTPPPDGTKEGEKETPQSSPSAAEPVEAAPEGGEERLAWIAERIEAVRLGTPEERRAACGALVAADRDGDCVVPLIDLLVELKRNPDVQVDIVRALGKPGLTRAVKPLAKLLARKHDGLRANAAVSLEYIASKEALADLRKRAPKEKDENIANHMYRAIGRCGAGDSKVRSLLAKAVVGAKSNLASYGPIIALGYFERDPKAAREVEKLVKKVTGDWRAGAKLALLTWCLSETGFEDPKAAKFIREEILPGILANRWTERFAGFYRAAADVCDGDASKRPEVEQGASGALSWAGRGGGRGPGGGGGGGGGNPLMDEARRDRDGGGFVPKGDWGG